MSTPFPALRAYEDVAPLDWFQFRALLWDALPDIQRRERAWPAVATAINAHCDTSDALPPAAYEHAFGRLAAQYPQLATSTDRSAGYRIWTEMLYGAAQVLFHRPVFMNLGFIDDESSALELAAEDELHRLAIHLYERALRGVPLAGADVIEIGCGGGGGCSFMRRYRGARRVVGIDLVEENVRTCAQTHAGVVQSFARGDAHRLPIAAAACDVAVSIESSGCYASMPTFLGEVCRVLRPGGLLVLADLRPVTPAWGSGRTASDVLRDVEAAGFDVVAHDDITAGVLRSVEVQDAPKQQFLAMLNLPPSSLRHFREILLCHGSRNYQQLAGGTLRYLRLVCAKPGS